MTDADLQQQANDLTLQGIALLEQRRWEESLAKFDEAIAIRETLPWRTEPLIAWGLSASWMNRSDALAFLDRIEDALRSIRRAIEVLSALPLAEHPAYVDRLLLAWINHGKLKIRTAEFLPVDEPFDDAEALLKQWGGDATGQRRALVAMMRHEQARHALRRGAAHAALDAVRLAIAALAPLPTDDAGAAQAGVLARGLLCRVLADLLDLPGGIARSRDWIAEATDAAEEALALARRHHFAGEIVSDLVRFGAHIYQKCQPHFLAEFLGEWISIPAVQQDEILKADMRNALLVVRAETEARALQASHDDAQMAKYTAMIRQLHVVEAQFAR